MEKFIREHLERMEVKIHCGGTEIFRGKVMPNPSEGVLILESEGNILTYIAIDKIIAIKSVKSKK